MKLNPENTGAQSDVLTTERKWSPRESAALTRVTDIVEELLYPQRREETSWTTDPAPLPSPTRPKPIARKFGSPTTLIIRDFVARIRGASTNDNSLRDKYPGLYDLVIEEAIGSVDSRSKVGASLYIYQQMYDLKVHDSPSQSKAQWLVPRLSYADRPFNQMPKMTTEKKIGEHWRDFYDISHVWAAFAASGTAPFLSDKETMTEFIRTVDASRFMRLAATFYAFRKRVKLHSSLTKKSALPYIKHELEGWNAFLGDFEPLETSEIPNLLTDNHWALLAHYDSGSKNIKK